LSQTAVSPDYADAERIFVKLMAGATDILWDNKNDLLATWNRSVETSEALKDMKAQDALIILPPKARALSKLFAYLGLVESLGVTLMDMSLILLIANGKEVHIRKDKGIMHVSTLKELRKLDLIYKLGFLTANKLEFIAGMVNRPLRNDIAHLKFSIGEEGEVKGSNGQVVNVDDVLREFWKRVGEIIAIFDHIQFLHFIEQGRIASGEQGALRPTGS
jgi:hypothetical protein